MGKKKISCFLIFPPPPAEASELAAESLELHRNNSKRAQKKGSMSHMVSSALSNHNLPGAHRIPWILCSQAFDLCFEDLLKARDRVPSISRTDQKKLADCMTCSFPTTSHFSVLLYISTPKTTEKILFTAPDFWNKVSGEFLIFSSLQRFPKAT